MSVRKSLAWSFSQEGIQKSIRFIGSIVVARLLTPDEVGVFAIAMAASFVMSSFQDFGVGTYLIREPVLTQDKIRTVFGLCILLQWSIGAIIFLLRNPLADIYGEPGVAEVLSVTSLSFFIGPFGQPSSAILRREMRFDIHHHISAIVVVTGTSTTIILAFLGMSYMAMAWGLLAGNVTRSILLLIARRDHLRLMPSLKHWRAVIKFGGWLTAAGFLGTAAGEGRNLIIGALLGPSSVALFQRSQQIPKVSREALLIPIGRVLLPSLSKDIRDGRQIGTSVEMYIASMTAIIWPAFSTIAFLGVPLIVIVFGENWRLAGEILPFILVSAAIISSLPQPETILTPHGAVQKLFIVRLVHFLTAIILATIGAMQSIEFFASLTIVAAIIFILTVFIITRPFLGISISKIYIIYFKAVALSVFCSSPAIYLYISRGVDLGAIEIAFAVVSSGIIWLIGLFALRHPLAKELTQLLKFWSRRT